MRYVDGLDTIPNTDADNALILGTALHTGIEEGVEQALDFYKNSFPVLTDDHIHEMMKLEAMIPKAKAMLPPGGTFELPIGNGDFIGFMDYLVPVDEDLSGKTEICDGCPILNKIEQWAERLPYKTLKIEVELPNQSLVLEKTRNRPVGFAPPPMVKGKGD